MAPTLNQDLNQVLMVSENGIQMFSEPEVAVDPIPEIKFLSPSIERKMSVVDPPNLQELNIPSEGGIKVEEKREKKISRFLVSPVVDKVVEDTAGVQGLPKGVEAVNSHQKPAVIPKEMGLNLNAEIQELSAVDKQAGRKCSAAQHNDVS